MIPFTEGFRQPANDDLFHLYPICVVLSPKIGKFHRFHFEEVWEVDQTVNQIAQKQSAAYPPPYFPLSTGNRSLRNGSRGFSSL